MSDRDVAIPEGDLRRARVVADLSAPLEDVLDRRLDGYAVLAPRETILRETGGHGIVTFNEGVPTLVYHAGTDRGGPVAVADIGAGPYRFELYALDADALGAVHDVGEFRVPPGMVAERLAGDPALAERTRRLATEAEPVASGAPDALEAFLDDEEGIEAVREAARREAERRAREWGFGDAI